MMEIAQMSGSIVICVLLLFKGQCCWCQCSKEEYRRCTLLADPLLKDPHLIYPDNLKDIEHVCRSWTQFVDCVKRYTDLCFTETKRREFNKAVESPVELVHHMCTSTNYQEEYMKHSRCMRAVLTEDIHCGRHYRQLVSQVSGEPATPALCCSHHRFRECVLDQTSRTCELDAPNFAKQILDRALSFLLDQCANYIPDQIDCPGSDFYSGGGAGRITGKWVDPAEVALAGIYRKSTTNNNGEDRRSTGGRKSDYPPSSAGGWSSQSDSHYATESGQIDSSGSSSRSTHGRGMNWPDESSSSSSGASTTESPPSDVSWKITSGGGSVLPTESVWSSISKTSTISGNLVDNEQPNQQGLSNRNTANSLASGWTLVAAISLVITVKLSTFHTTLIVIVC